MERKEGYTLSKTKQQKIAWIEPGISPDDTAGHFYRLNLTVAEALEVMGGRMDCKYTYQERVIRELMRLQKAEKGYCRCYVKGRPKGHVVPCNIHGGSSLP